MPLFERSLPGRKLALVEGQVADAAELPDLPCVESGVRAADDSPSGAGLTKRCRRARGNGRNGSDAAVEKLI
ncbi:hypothetical protein QT972_00515 [Microcoleus sp. herbarium7]|uniref:hypothetical protein n=1 Tax=Microcoleus sp. herbarium7 TaxID=3055435 RepID=UPI002FCFE5E3